MRYLYKLQYIVATLLAALFLWGCIDDHISKCRLSLQFEYTLHNYSGDRLSDEIKSFTLYIYDDKDEFVSRKQVGIEELDSENCIKLTLPSMKHSVVVWGNYCTESYRCVHDLKLHENSVTLVDKTSNNEVKEIALPLFYGFVEVQGKKDTPYIVSMIKNTNRIKVIIKQAPLSRGGDDFTSDYKVKIYSSNGTYKFDNSIAGTEQLTYIPKYSSQETDTHADFMVMRLAPDSDMRVVITDRSDQNIEIDQLVAQEIMSVPGSDISTQRDFDRYDEHTLVYELTETTDGTYILALIKINDWDVISSGGGV